MNFRHFIAIFLLVASPAWAQGLAAQPQGFSCETGFKILYDPILNGGLHLDTPKGNLSLLKTGGAHNGDSWYGGSTGGNWYIDQAGTHWFLKPEGPHNELQSAAEVISSLIYRRFGYTTANNIVLENGGRRYLASKSLALDEFNQPRSVHLELDLHSFDRSDFRQSRVVAAYLKDWDRIQSPNSFSFGSAAKRDGFIQKDFAFFDFGGSLGSRSMGEHKPGKVFSAATGAFEPTEDITKIYGEFNTSYLPANHPWKKITAADVRAVVEKFRSLTDADLNSIVSVAHYSKAADAEHIFQGLRARRDGIIKYLPGLFPEKETLPGILANLGPKKELLRSGIEQLRKFMKNLEYAKSFFAEVKAPATKKPVPFQNFSWKTQKFNLKDVPPSVRGYGLTGPLFHSTTFSSAGGASAAITRAFEEGIEAQRVLDPNLDVFDHVEGAYQRFEKTDHKTQEFSRSHDGMSFIPTTKDPFFASIFSTANNISATFIIDPRGMNKVDVEELYKLTGESLWAEREVLFRSIEPKKIIGAVVVKKDQNTSEIVLNPNYKPQ